MVKNNTEQLTTTFTELAQAIVKIEENHKQEIELLDFKGACCFLNLKESMLRKLVFLKKVPHFKIGKNLRFKKSDLESWLETECRA